MKSTDRSKKRVYFSLIFIALSLAACSPKPEKLVAVRLTPPDPPRICVSRITTLKITKADTTAAQEAREKQRIVDDRERLADRALICRRYICGVKPAACGRRKKPKPKIS